MNTSRGRIVLLTIILSLLNFFFQANNALDFRSLLGYEFAFDIVKPLILAVITYFGAYWALFGKVSGERFVTILFFPVAEVFSLAVFSEILINSGIGEGSNQLLLVLNIFGVASTLAMIFAIITYITLLTVNLLNASYLQNIPLGQAARAVQFVLSLIIAYLTYFLLFNTDVQVYTLIVRLGILWGITGLLVYMSLSDQQRRHSDNILTAFVISLIVLWAAMVLSVWPLASTYLALVLTLLFYICLSIALEEKEIISNYIWTEYLALLVIIIFILVVFADWGINGVLFF